MGSAEVGGAGVVGECIDGDGIGAGHAEKFGVDGQVVVHAAAVEQDALAVESQALACIAGQRADTKALSMGVEQGAVCVVQFDACGVERRRIWGPESGVGDGAGVVSSIVIRYS